MPIYKHKCSGQVVSFFVTCYAAGSVEFKGATSLKVAIFRLKYHKIAEKIVKNSHLHLNVKDTLRYTPRIYQKSGLNRNSWNFNGQTVLKYEVLTKISRTRPFRQIHCLEPIPIN